MKLYEYEAKNVLTKYGIPTPAGGLATTKEKAVEIAEKLKLPVMVKAQALVAGRGKAGGILSAEKLDNVGEAAEDILNLHLKGIQVKSVWIEEKIRIKRELYFGITTDRFNRSYVAVASGAGGIEIEEVAEKSPEKIFRLQIDQRLGLRSFHTRQLACRMGYSGRRLTELGKLLERLFIIAMDLDAELIEMNPLVETANGEFVAADARIIIDDNSLFRHQEYMKRSLEEERDLSPQELKAKKSDLAYVKLDGNIGVIGNGAGLVMATLDTIQHYGGRPANFLDIGGGAPPEKTALSLDIVLSDPSVKAILINILGGITRCDEVAKGILESKQRIGVASPMVIRLVGTNEKAGKRILEDAGIAVLDSMEEAARRVVEIADAAGD